VRGAGVGLAVLLAAAALSQPACEKETHRAARRAFQEIQSRDLSPPQQAAALEEFVRLYPEPKTNPNLVRACTQLAEYHSRAGRADIAASWYERALRASPDDPDLLNALGYHYALNRMNLDRAVTVLDAAVRLAEERRYPPRRLGFIKDSLGWAYRMRGDLPLSVALLEEAARLAPDATVIQEHLADAYRALGDRDRAVEVYLEIYLKSRGTHPGWRDALRDIGREEGPAASREIERRMSEGLRDLVEADRKETEATGARQVQLRAADGPTLFGSLYRPADRIPRATAAKGAVLLLHPLGSSRSTCATTARALSEAGLAALALDLRGHGASVSEALPDAHAFSLRLADNLRDAEQDVRAGLAFLARLPGVERGRIGVVGAGLGALLAARALELDDDAPAPRALVLISPWGRPEAYNEPLARLPPDAVIVVAGSEEGAPLATARALAAPDAAGSGRRLVVASGSAAHFELPSADTGVMKTLVSFLRERLEAAPRAAGDETSPAARVSIRPAREAGATAPARGSRRLSAVESRRRRPSAP